MLIVSMLRMLGGETGETAGACAYAAREPATARDNPATEQNHFFMSAHLPGARCEIAKLERFETVNTAVTQVDQVQARLRRKSVLQAPTLGQDARAA